MRNAAGIKFLIFWLAATAVCFAGESFAQTTKNPVVKRNSPYSPNPKKRTEQTDTILQESPNGNIEKQKVVEIEPADIAVTPPSPNPTIAEKTLEIAKRKRTVATQPTEIYRVGAGDVLDIRILNSPSKDSSLFTVLTGGTIDYPLAGNEPITVGGLTPEEIENLLSEKVSLYKNAEVTVNVRDYASRKITVLGLVERPGAKYLRRVAIPLYVILAEAIPLSHADKISITRSADNRTVEVAWEDTETLVYEGDVIRVGKNEIKAQSAATQFYYIGGEIISGGQKNFQEGITLTQAILANGGLKKNSIKKVIIRRKNSDGMLMSLEFDLKSIKEGKTVDPQLRAGDTVEIGQ